jgi:phenylpropionate dioxygenase-like ring-hydroxylating dioxygenase large terminal subunit
MFVRDCWYMAGWSRDFERGRPVAVTMLNEPIVIYRTADGSLVALQDRCCHRFAPLSRGRVEGDEIRCMYHGLKFAPTGRCVEIPGQEKIPPQARVRSYPIAERYSGAWLWMGEPGAADIALIPEFVGVDDPRWAMNPGRMDYNANFMLINDNLLDLSHIPFLHERSLGATLSPAGVSRPRVTRMPRGVRIQNWINSDPSKMVAALSEVRSDIWQTYDFVVPGVFLLRADFYPEGTAQKFPDSEPEGVTPLHRQFTCQAVTPLTEDRTCYFFAYGPWARDRALKDAFHELGLKAFNEDRSMIEAQQKNLALAAGAKMLTIAADSGVAQFRRMMDDFIRAESQPNGAAAARPAAEEPGPQ